MLCVIFLVWAAIDWADAVGTSAALSLPISLTGTLGYAIAGWNFPELPPYSVGFVYLPGMFCLLVSSMSMAVVGARLAHSPRLPMQALRRWFRGRQYPSRSFDTPLRPFQMIPAQLKKQSRSSAPAYSNTPPSLRKTLPPGERTQKIPAGKPVGMFFFAGGPSVT